MLKVKDELQRKKGRCPFCKSIITIPATQEAAAPDYGRAIDVAFSGMTRSPGRIYMAPIPEKMLENARNNCIKPWTQDESPRIYIDLMALSGKHWLLITDRSCYYRTGLGPGHCSLGHVVACPGKTGFPNYKLTIELNYGATQLLTIPDKKTLAAVERFFVCCADLNAKCGLQRGGHDRTSIPGRKRDYSEVVIKEFTRRCLQSGGACINDIPEKLLSAAEKSYGLALAGDEKPLVLVVLDRESEGLLFTPQACHYGHTQGSGWFRYDQVRDYFVDSKERTILVETADSHSHILRFVTGEAHNAAESLLNVIVHGKPITAKSAGSKREYACPKCGAILDWFYVPSSNTSMLGSIFKTAFVQSVKRLRCPECGPIKDSDLNEDDQEALSEQRRNSAVVAIVAGAIIVGVVILILALFR
ncbi:MAG: hypothetical protein JXN61_17370 [Sedimentisphaerales bacterium]|nr:hypothetical protein [Sedimentisphaerales bacterium]